ncbi:unnamed protein product [Rotaria sordida]|uniref:Endonuclease/exonuclease/phosphatase domain-containing protein n=1 Tax=Rotaria sordida TaxID=392033 RepID=A0A815LIR1_9BILA|nr:unnamed protein product [Rotaria sordida]CAF1410496.1 unnamed protein product [Rotaria sordida]
MIFEEWTSTPTLDLLIDKWSIYRDKTLSMLNIKDNISILLLNVSSLNCHMVEIFKLIDTTSPPIITLNGTHHDERSTKQFTKHFFNYNVFSINGTNAFGGVLVAIHKSIRTQRMVEFENIPNLIALEIGEEQNKFQLVTCYSPPHEQIPFEIFDRILQKNENTIFTGDLNAKHNSWSRSVENPKGKTLFNWLSSSPTHATMEIINKFIPTSTRSKATIDLIFAPSHMASDTFSVLPSIGSDHHPVIWRSAIKISTAHQKYPIKRTHWKLFEVFLTFTGSYWNKLAEDMAHSTTFFTLYERFLSLSISRFTNVTFRKSFKPTLPQDIILLINKKHMYLKLFRRTYHPYYAIMLRDISKLVQKTLFQYKRKLWLDYCGSFNDCDTKSFLQKAKRHFRSKSTPVEGFVINNNTITSPDEMCAVAKNYYEEQFTDHQDTKTDIDIEARINVNELNEILINNPPNPMNITYQQLYRIITSLKKKNSSANYKKKQIEGFNRQIYRIMHNWYDARSIEIEHLPKYRSIEELSRIHWNKLTCTILATNPSVIEDFLRHKLSIIYLNEYLSNPSLIKQRREIFERGRIPKNIINRIEQNHVSLLDHVLCFPQS